MAFFSSSDDPVRCALGIAAGCASASVAGITSPNPNPNLEPEKATSKTLGAVWDITPKTSLSIDLWEIKRKNEINQESTTEAVAKGNVARDPGGSLFAGDPGPLTAVLVNYVNSAQSTIRGIDVDFKHRMDLADGMGRVNFGLVWTHLAKWERTEKDGTKFEWAGTIGNHDVTNATGTPKDRVNVGLGWDVGRWRIASLVNYRGSLINKFAKYDADCATHISVGGPHGPLQIVG